MEQLSKEIARELLAIGAVELRPYQPFTWTSGLRAPIYTDNRLIISHPEARQKVVSALVETIKKHFSDIDVIAGTATAGIPHAAMVAHIMDLPMIYVRSEAKGHGKKSAIEGYLPKGAKVVVIEDLISTGQSVIQAANQVEAAGGEVLGCLAIFSYLLKESEENFENTTYPLVTLTDYRTLIDVATESAELRESREILEQWYQDPVTWSKKL